MLIMNLILDNDFLHYRYFFILFLFFAIVINNAFPHSFSITLKNNTDISRNNEIVKLELKKLKERYPNFNFESFKVLENNFEIQSEIIYDEIKDTDMIFLLLNFQSKEKKRIIFTDSLEASINNKKTKAYLGEKAGYKKKDGFYTGGTFKSIDSVKVPTDHFSHDALYQFEGPGWESEKVGYRLYLDDRNRIDIFGKKRPNLIIDLIGKDDLVSDGKESYQKMHEWGMDIFKVGNSLGIGSIGTYADSIKTISEADSLFCEVINNDLISGVKTIHYGWEVNEEKYNITSYFYISAESRLTKSDIKLNKEIENLCTGIAKHGNTEFFHSDNNGWNYIGLWGKQTLINDNLGVALFYDKQNLLKLSEDNLNYFVILKPENKELTYYFAAAWEQEENGIKSIEEFKNYLNLESEKLNNPIQIDYSAD